MRRTLALVLALASLTAGFGAIDLLSPFVLHEGTQASDVGYGTLAGIVMPAALLARWRGRCHAGLGQLWVTALALLIAGVAAAEVPLLVAAAVVAAAALGLGERRVARSARQPRSRPLIVLALVACWPATRYAFDMAANQRHGVEPLDAHLALHAWAALAAAALAALFTTLLAAARGDAAAVGALSAASAVAVWAAACLVYPRSAGAVAAPWAWTALAWGAAVAILGVWSASKRCASSR